MIKSKERHLSPAPRAASALPTAKRFLAEGWRVALLDIDGDNLKKRASPRSASPA